MSERYDVLLAKWHFGYITADTLRGWVALNDRKPGKGITPEEYEQITGEPYAVINSAGGAENE